MNAVLHEDIFLPRLGSVEIFKGQDEALLEALGKQSEFFEVRKGEQICNKGKLTNGLFCVFKGKVKLTVISHNGNERVMEIVGSGGVFGEASMFLEQPSLVHAEALAKTQLVYLRRNVIFRCHRPMSRVCPMPDRWHEWPLASAGS